MSLIHLERCDGYILRRIPDGRFGAPFDMALFVEAKGHLAVIKGLQHDGFTFSFDERCQLRRQLIDLGFHWYTFQRVDKRFDDGRLRDFGPYALWKGTIS